MYMSRIILVLLLPCATARFANAQSNPTYVQFSPPAVKGALYRPDAPAPVVRKNPPALDEK